MKQRGANKSLLSPVIQILLEMSLYNDAGREKLAKWLINCIYIDLAISGIILFLNFIGTYEYIRERPLSAAIVVALVLFYIAIIRSIREKLLKPKEDPKRKISEIFATFYFFIHVIFYILIIGLFFSGMYLGLTRIQVSSDFLLSWAIILSALIQGVFYLRNKGYRPSTGPEPEGIHTDPRWDYPDGHLSTEDRDPNENKWDIPVKGETEEEKYQREHHEAITRLHNAKIPAYLNCYICGKRDILPLKGKDGRYYCRDHILPENRVIEPDSVQSIINSAPKPDTRCKNPRCKREIYHTGIIQCGPCGNFFCKYCWEGHRWSHGKAPAVGISYTSDGTFSGYDGSEQIKRDR